MAKRIGYLLILILLFSSCASTSEKSSSKNLTDVSYNIFFDQGDHLKKLIEAKDYEGAAKLYDLHYEVFFKSKWRNYSGNFAVVADNLNKKYEQDGIKIENDLANIDTQWPLPDTKWEQVEQTLESANNILREYNNYRLLKNPDFRLSIFNRLEQSLSTNNKRISDSSVTNFRSFNHFQGKSFFDLYPANLDTKKFMNDNFPVLRNQFSEASKDQIVDFVKTYSLIQNNSSFLNKEYFDFISNAYVSAYLREMTKDTPINLTLILKSLKEAKDLGFTPSSVPNVKIAFAEVTSATLMNEGQIEFPTKVEMDLPFEVIKIDIDDLFISDNIKDADLLILLSVNTASTKRRIQERQQIPSRFIAGQRSLPNPQYEIARMNLYQCENEYARINNTYVANWVELALKVVALAVAQNKVNQARNILSYTSPVLEESVYQDYKFNVSSVEDVKTLSVIYYMIDKINNKYLKSIFDISEKNNFNLCYQVHDHDADKSTISIKYNKEDDIKTFEEAPVSVRLSSIIEDFLANASSSGPLPSETALRIEILSDKNKALSHYAAKKQMLTPVNDPRLDSVVVVLNPSGPTGTGFFVKPDHVITNYHIIEGSKFVEMKLHNGLETFGKIVKSDVRLDLALIKVESRGKSIVFRDENKPIEVGATVEAIGHPKGFEFSITRGIVSNFRKADSVFAPGGKQILYIQTDAAISPGNSGGPLFLGEEVIGMNTQKMVANAVEGLGFAIHFSEILTFLEKDF